MRSGPGSGCATCSRSPGVVVVGHAARGSLGGRRRVQRRHAHGLGHGPVARADDRRPDERRAAAAVARLPRAAHHPRPVRLRVGDEVARGARADDARGLRRLLGPARLGQGGADPDPVADRHAARRFGRRRPRADRRDRLGTGSRHQQGRGRDRRGVARRGALGTHLGHDLGPVGRGLGRDAGTAHGQRPRDRWDRRGPGRAIVTARAGWRSRLAHGLDHVS